jgi:2-haloacid dehalogenase/putative hydrolase of the HAD superfamily
MKKILLIDLDNTLIDFNECARHSIMNAFEKLGFDYSPVVFDTFIEENAKIWKRLERGEITKPQLRANRWNIILARLGIEFDGTILEEMFENGVAQGAYAVTGAYDLLDYLKDKYEMYIVSNGFRYVQESRLKIGDFNKYFNNIFVSEDIGIPKPAKEFFDYCFAVLKKNDDSILPENVLMIGDSLSSDMKGAVDFGFKTCFFDKKEKGVQSELKLDFYIKNLFEIKKII